VGYQFEIFSSLTMATYPYCDRFLSDHHRCLGVWRLRARRLGVAVAGTLAGVLVPFLFPGYHGTPLAVVVSGLLGALVASMIWTGLTL
jgi:hypothetical protein